MELQFARVPKKQQVIDGFRQRFTEGIERMVLRESFDPTAEYSVKYTIQRKGYQNAGDPRPPEEPVEEWLEVRYRFVDDGSTVEVVSVTSTKFSI